jgi:protein PhnA
MSNPSQCPKCQSENIYQDGNLWTCPECSNEWTASESAAAVELVTTNDNTVKDAHGNVLSDGDNVSVIKDLKIKGASSTIKSGTKVKNIKLADVGDGHNISCRIDGIGSINLKSEFVKKI